MMKLTKFLTSTVPAMELEPLAKVVVYAEPPNVVETVVVAALGEP